LRVKLSSYQRISRLPVPAKIAILIRKRECLGKRDDPEQSKAFIEKAHEIEADEEHSAADKLMERLAKTKPEPRSANRK